MASQSDNNKAYEGILREFKESYNRIVKRLSLPFNFNILDAQCGTIKENSHTNIFMKLLEYKNQYGYVFLKDFIKQADFNIQIVDSSPVTFETEYFVSIPVEPPANNSENKQETVKKKARKQSAFCSIFSIFAKISIAIYR